MIAVREPSTHSRVLQIEGSFRAPVGIELRCGVKALLQRGERRILLNLTGVSEIDAAGVGELVHVYHMATASNAVVRIVQPTARVRRALDLVGLFKLLTTGSGAGSGKAGGQIGDEGRIDCRGRVLPDGFTGPVTSF